MSLEIKGLRKSYKNVDALKSLSFGLEPGKAVALLGPNGAGKSTAIKLLVTLLQPDGGEFNWQGQNLFKKPGAIRDLLGYVSQELAMDKQLTGAEFMRFCAGVKHLHWKKIGPRAHELLDQMGLSEAKDQLVGEYSGGMKRRLDLASALLTEPQILVLDEPTTGLDIEARETIWKLIHGFMEQGCSLILASHDFREVQELTDHVLIMEKGSVLKEGSPDDLKNALGDLIIRLKTKEFMDPQDMTSVRAVFEKWGDAVTWHDDETFATLAFRGDDSMSQLQSRIYDAMSDASLEVDSLNLQRPDLEDVYRFALGGQ